MARGSTDYLSQLFLGKVSEDARCLPVMMARHGSASVGPMLGLLLPLQRATDWRTDPHGRQRRHGLGLPGRVPGGPATRMQPHVAGGFDAIGQQCIVSAFTIATSETAPDRRAFRVAVQPFDDATGQR